jgi:FkbM family methyltransferase
VAFSSKTEVSTFHYRDLSPGSALHALEAPRNWRGDDFEPVFSLATLGYRLDDFVRQFGLPSPNHIKLDVDGMEYQILRGAEETLRSPSLRSLLMEANEDDKHAAEIASLLADSGLQLCARMRENCLYIRS